MPSGYTADISKGISFEEYAWGCARAFGALVTMRDEPAGATIPERFEQTSYYAEHLDETKKKIKWLEKLAKDEKACEKQAKADYDKQYKYYEDRKREIDDQLAKYNAMLEQVRAFNPPSPDHVPLKDFMENQILESIKFDCNHEYNTPPEKLTAKQWLARELKSAESNLKYYTKEHTEEIKRVCDRNNWVKQLREAIGPQPKSNKSK